MVILRLRTLAATYLRIGNTTFGGGDPTTLALQKDLVDTRGALTLEQSSLSYLIARVTPGTNILAYCAATGYQLRGWRGALIAVTAVAVPSAAVAVAVSGAFEAWTANPWGASAIQAMLAAAVGLMFAGVWAMVRPQVRRGVLVRTVVLAASFFALSWWVQLSPLQLIGVAALAGALWREPR